MTFWSLRPESLQYPLFSDILDGESGGAGRWCGVWVVGAQAIPGDLAPFPAEVPAKGLAWLNGAAGRIGHRLRTGRHPLAAFVSRFPAAAGSEEPRLAFGLLLAGFRPSFRAATGRKDGRRTFEPLMTACGLQPSLSGGQPECKASNGTGHSGARTAGHVRAYIGQSLYQFCGHNGMPSPGQLSLGQNAPGTEPAEASEHPPQVVNMRAITDMNRTTCRAALARCLPSLFFGNFITEVMSLGIIPQT
jgi:hypothetical protein